MFNPELRYALFEQDGEIPNFMYPDVVIEIYRYTSNILMASIAMIIIYNLFSYNLIAMKYICSYIWNMLTPGNELLDLLLIGSTIAAGITIFMLLKAITDIMDEAIIKLKNEMKKKDDRIRELEQELALKKN